VVASTVGIAAEPPGRVHLGKIGRHFLKDAIPLGFGVVFLRDTALRGRLGIGRPIPAQEMRFAGNHIMGTPIALFAAALLAASAMTMAASEGPPPEAKPTPESIAKAEKAVTEHLEKLKGAGAAVRYIQDDAVEKAFPRYYLFAVLFRQFPVGRVPPKGLKASNLFAVDGDAKVTTLTDAKGLEKFFQSNLAAVKEEAQMKTAIRAWLRLTQQHHQDGFYTFRIMDDAIKVEGKTARGTVVAMKGGSGTLSARLTFDDEGKLSKVSEEAKLRPGPRPICHATKLLDSDPLVRRIAEQDLLIMGTAARDYLNEQRAKASPELRRAIDRLWQRILDAER
jgi:hypothetical protein